MTVDPEFPNAFFEPRRPKRHSQQPAKQHLTCSNCHMGVHDLCINVSLRLAGARPHCMCTDKFHETEDQ